MQRISEIVPSLMERLRAEKRGDCEAVSLMWQRIVGQDISRYSRPVWMSGGELLVEVDSGTVMQVLRYKKAHITKEINRCLQNRPISNIAFRLGG